MGRIRRFLARVGRRRHQLEIITCPTCDQIKIDLHEKLGCEHYGNIRSLFENNLEPDELAIFNSLESRIIVGDVEYTVGKRHQNENGADPNDNTPAFTNVYSSTRIIVNIKADAARFETHMPYQSTIHEIWHVIDFCGSDNNTLISYQRRLYNTIHQDIEDRLKRLNITRQVFYDNFRNEFLPQWQSYSDSGDILNNAQMKIQIEREDMPRIYRIDYELNRPNKTEQERNDLINERTVRQQRIDNRENARRNVINLRDPLNEYFYVCDILEGERNVFNITEQFTSPMTKRSANYWDGENGKKILSSEFIAAVGCIRAAHPSALNKMIEYFPKSYDMYLGIIRDMSAKLNNQ